MIIFLTSIFFLNSIIIRYFIHKDCCCWDNIYGWSWWVCEEEMEFQ